MRRWILIWAVILSAFDAAGQSNILTGTAGDYGLTGQTGVTATLTLLYPNPRTSGSFLVRQDPMSRVTSSTGEFRFTNVLWGKYQLSLSGRVATPFTFWVGTNTTGEVAIASLVTNAAAIPPNPATNYYTQAQIDALLADLEVGTGGGSPTTNAVDLTTGTLSDERLSANVPLLSADTNSFSGRIEALSIGVDSMTIGTLAVDSFVGNMSGGTNANPTNLFAAGSYIPPQFLGSGELTGTRFLRVDGTWTLIEGGGDMLKANNLSDVVDAGASRTNIGAHLAANLKGPIPNENLTSVISTNFSWWDNSGTLWLSNNVNGLGIGVAAATDNTLQTKGAAKFGGNIIGANGAKFRNRHTTNWVALASSGTQVSLQIGGTSDPSDSYPALVNSGSTMLIAGGLGGTNTDAAVMGGFALQARDASPEFFTGFSGGAMLWSDGTNLMATTKNKVTGTLTTNAVAGTGTISDALTNNETRDVVFAGDVVGIAGRLEMGDLIINDPEGAIAGTQMDIDTTAGILSWANTIKVGWYLQPSLIIDTNGITFGLLRMNTNGAGAWVWQFSDTATWDATMLTVDPTAGTIAAGGGVSFTGTFNGTHIGSGYSLTNIPQRNITRTNDLTMTTSIALAYPFAAQLLTMTDNVSVTGYTWAGTNTVYGTVTATNSSGATKTLTLPAGTVTTTGSRVLYVTNLLELNVKISGLSTSAWYSATW